MRRITQPRVLDDELVPKRLADETQKRPRLFHPLARLMHIARGELLANPLDLLAIDSLNRDRDRLAGEELVRHRAKDYRTALPTRDPELPSAHAEVRCRDDRRRAEMGRKPKKGVVKDPLAALFAELDRELAWLRRPGASDKLRKIFASTPAEIAKAANAARRHKRWRATTEQTILVPWRVARGTK